MAYSSLIWLEWKSGHSYLSYLVRDVVGLVIERLQGSLIELQTEQITGILELNGRRAIYVHRRVDGAIICLRNEPGGQIIYDQYSNLGRVSQVFPHSIDRLRSIEDGVVFQDGRKIGRFLFRPDLPDGYQYTLLYVLPTDFVLTLYTETHFLLDESTIVEMQTDRRIQIPAVSHLIECPMVDRFMYLFCQNFVYRWNLSSLQLTSVPWQEDYSPLGSLIDDGDMMLVPLDPQTYQLRSVTQTGKLLRTLHLPDSPTDLRCHRTNGRYYSVGEQPISLPGYRYTFYG